MAVVGMNCPDNATYEHTSTAHPIEKTHLSELRNPALHRLVVWSVPLSPESRGSFAVEVNTLASRRFEPCRVPVTRGDPFHKHLAASNHQRAYMYSSSRWGRTVQQRTKVSQTRKQVASICKACMKSTVYISRSMCVHPRDRERGDQPTNVKYDEEKTDNARERQRRNNEWKE